LFLKIFFTFAKNLATGEFFQYPLKAIFKSAKTGHKRDGEELRNCANSHDPHSAVQ
jgi:hypothetical protein